MGALVPFDFESHAVRVVMQDDEPVFVAADVCRVVEIKKYRDAVAQLDEDERVSVSVDTLGGRQAMIGVTESGLYALILMGRKPSAKRFRKWVTSEVLPALRRDGVYAMPNRGHDELAAKRAYFAALPEAPKAKAEGRAELLAQVEALIAAGWRVDAAVRAVAAEAGIGASTLHAHRARVWMVASPDWPAAMAPRHRAAPRRALANCHPEAARRFLALAATGLRITDCYRELVRQAEVHGWHPVPSELTLRRAAGRALPMEAA